MLSPAKADVILLDDLSAWLAQQGTAQKAALATLFRAIVEELCAVASLTD